MWYVYILRSLKDGKHYIGHTSDVEKRLSRHNSGGNISTQNRRPFVLVRVENFPTKASAMVRERKIKSYKGGILFKKLIEFES